MTQIGHFPLFQTQYLPSICQRSNCLRDAVKGTNFCTAHQPKPKAAPPAWTGKDVVYMVGMEGEDSIKIGYASELSVRMVGMQVGNPKKLLVLAVFGGNVVTESHLHKELQDYHVRGEWFDADACKALARKLADDRYACMRLKVDSVICPLKEDGYPWDLKGIRRRKFGKG